MAATKKARAAEFQGVEYTESSLAQMRTGDIANLVAAISGGAAPKPATKARAIDLFFKAAESLPKAPEPIQKLPVMPDARPTPLVATAETQGAEKQASAKARKAKMYSVRINGPEAVAKVAAMTPQARGLAEAMRAAGRPLSMADCSALLDTKRSNNPSKVVAWYFAKVFRPAQILVEERGR
jgi:hypothetical protein